MMSLSLHTVPNDGGAARNLRADPLSTALRALHRRFMREYLIEERDPETRSVHLAVIEMSKSQNEKRVLTELSERRPG